MDDTGDIKGMLVGCFVGDSLGVPFEFRPRELLRKEPATTMIGFGTHSQPAGSWSDDSSLTWCLAETIVEGYSVEKLAVKFLAWMFKGEYTANGKSLFDIGISTRTSLLKLASGKYPPTACGGTSEDDNGNGSLMRIAPLITLLRPLGKLQRFQLVKEVSSITHAHIRSILACYYFCEFLLYIQEVKDKYKAYKLTNSSFKQLFEISELRIPTAELKVFKKLIDGAIFKVDESSISSSGYVVSTLECIMWVFLNSPDDFRVTLLRGINMGDDTDTVGAILGSLLGFYLGYSGIPDEWIQQVKRIDEVLKTAENLKRVYAS